MDWVIHIGPQKTGSKAIQRFLDDGTRIRSPRVVFPTEGRRGIWHEPLMLALQSGDASAVTQATAHHARTDWDLGVWSSEAFCVLTPEAIALFRSALGPARIILFVRRQDDRANSLLNQFVMAHRVNIAQIREFRQNVTRYNPAFDYRVLIDAWADSFGIENVRPLLYDKQTDVVEAFSEACGIELGPATAAPNNPNPALDEHSYAVLLRRKEMFTGSEEELVHMVEATHAEMRDNLVDTLSRPGIELFDAATRGQIMDLYAGSNEWVRQTWFLETDWPR